MLRQRVGEGLSLADFVDAAAPTPFGVFAASVHTCGTLSVSRRVRAARCRCSQCEAGYEPMLLRSIKVTLAEAVSCWIDAQIEGQLAAAGLEGYKIVKPAAGYSSCPDHTMKKDIMELIPGSEALGIEFTESYAMIPDASICGFVFIHPSACYPEIRNISREQLDDYARRRGLDGDQCRRFLGHMLQDE